MPNALGQLLAASLIAAPAAVALALVMVPETVDEKQRAHEPDFEYESTMDAFATGASDGLKILANIVTMLIAAFALLFLSNVFLGWAGATASFSPWETAKGIDIESLPSQISFFGLFGIPLPEFVRGPLDFILMGLEWVFEVIAMIILWIAKIVLIPFGLLQGFAGDAQLSIELLLGWVFAPIMYMVGVPMNEAAQSGSLIGIKTVLTEFVAFLQLAGEGGEGLSERSSMITAHAICGFANFGSIGILIGGLSIIEPARRTTFLELAWKTLVAGTLATCLSGAVVGALPASLFFGG